MADAQLIFDTKIDTGNFEKGLSNISGLMSSTFKIGSAAITATTGAIAGLAVKSLQFTGDLEQNMGGAEAVFNSFANTVKSIGETAFKDMGLSASDFLATVNKMGALMQGSGFGIEQSMDLSTKAMQRAADVASIMGIDISMAMESIAGAAKGNFTMMDNLGVAMNATTIEAYALSKGIETSYSSMDNAQKIGLAMEMFLERTTYAAGNYAKENETLSGSLNTAKAAFVNFLSGVGDLSTLTDSVSNAANVVVKNLQDIVPKLSESLPQIFSSFAKAIPPLFESLLPVVVNGATTLLKGVAKTLYDNRRQILKTAADIGSAILMAIFGADIKSHWDKFVRDIIAALETFSSVAMSILKPVGAILEGMFKFVLDNSTLIISTLTGVGTAMLALNVASSITKLKPAFALLTTQLIAYGATVNGNTLIQAAAIVIMKAKGAAALVMAGEMTIAGAAVSVLTALQTALNLVTAAYPGAMLALAIGAVIGAIAFLAINTNKASAETRALIDDTKKLIEETNKLNEEIAESNTKYEEKIRLTEQDVTVASDLIGKIEELANVEHRSAEQKSLLAGYVQQLNTIYPELNLQYDKELDALSMSTKEIENKASAIYNMAKMQALSEKLVENARQEIELNEKLVELSERREEIESKLISSSKNKTFFGGATKDTKELRESLEQVDMQINETDEGLNALRLSTNNLTSEQIALGSEIDNTTKELEALGEAGANASNATSDLTETLQEQSDTIRTLASDLDSAESAYQSVSSAQSISASTAYDLLDEYRNLISSNTELLAQYPELYAALDANNSVQENSKAIAEAVWKIKRQLLIDELTQQTATVESNIKALEAQRDAAIITYSEIAKAAAITRSITMEAIAAKAEGEVKTIEAAIEDAKNQAAGIGKIIEDLKKQEMPRIDIGVKSGGAGKEAKDAAKALSDAFNESKLAIEAYKQSAEATIEGEIELWQKLSDKHKEGSKEHIEITKNINKLNDQLRKQNFDNSKKWIDEEKYYNRLSTEGELAAWLRIQARYEQGSDERKEADRQVYTLRNKLSKESYDALKSHADDYKNSLNYTVQGEIDLWEYAKDKYAENSEERIEINKNIQSLLIQQEKDSIQKKIDLLNDLKYKEIDLATSVKDTKISLIDAEARAKIDGIDDGLNAFMDASDAEIQRHIDVISMTDAVAAARLQSIKNEMDGIKKLQDADKERARINREDQEKERLQADIDKANSQEEYEKAIKAATEYANRLKQERIDREREARLEALQVERQDVIDAATKRIDEETQLIVDLTKKQQTEIEEVKKGLESDKTDAGKLIVEPIKADIKEETQTLQESGKDINKSIAIGIEENLDVLKKPSEDIVNATIKTIEDNFEKFKPLAEDLCAELSLQFDSQPWNDIGYNMILGIVSGVRNATSQLIDSVSLSMKSALRAVRETLGIASPARETISDGINLVLGYVKGIEDTTPTLMSTIQGISADMLSNPINAFNINEHAPIQSTYNYAGVNHSVGQPVQFSYTEALRLLKELVSLTKAGQTIEMDGQTLARATSRAQGDYFRQVGKTTIPL